MNRRLFLKGSVLAGAAACVLPGGRAFANKALQSADSPLVILEGTPRERGRIYGETLKAKIEPFIGVWKAFLQLTSGTPADAIIADFLGHTRFDQAIRRYTPELWEELRGLAEGSGIAFDSVLAFNMPDEMTWYARQQMAKKAPPAPDKCSTLGFERSAGVPPIIGQNMDIPSGSEGCEVLLHIKEPASPRESYLFSVAGVIGIVGLSNAPVGLINNNLSQMQTSRSGLPVNFVVRGVLAQNSYADAVAFLKKVPHASGHNYLLGGPETAQSFECSAHKVVEFRAEQFPGAVYHTNHPFVNDDQLPEYAGSGAKPDEKPTSTQARCAVLEKHLAALPSEIDVETVKSILSSREDPDWPVCVSHKPWDPGASFTAGCLIMEMTTPPVLHLAPGPPCETEFKTYTF